MKFVSHHLRHGSITSQAPAGDPGERTRDSYRLSPILSLACEAAAMFGVFGLIGLAFVVLP